MEFFSFFQKFNLFDIFFIIASFVSIFLAIKNGFIKSVLNLIKWLLIIYIIKNSFSHLRPFFDYYIHNQTLADIIIFITIAILSYILLSIIVKIVDSIIQPRFSGIIGITLSLLLGLIRAYIIFVFIVFFVNNNISINYTTSLINGSEFKSFFNFGISLIGDYPGRLNNILL